MRLPRFLASIVVVAAFLIIALAVQKFAVADMAGRIIRPVAQAAFSVKNRVWNFAAVQIRAAGLAGEISKLQKEALVLSEENARLLELQEENARLRQELDFFESERYPITVARIVSRITEQGSVFFVLNRGERDGIAVGAPVIYGGTLIGKITKSGPTFSVAVPLSASGVKTAATLPGILSTSGIVEGELNVALILRLVPKDVALHEGVKVITSGLEDRVPRGLLIGTIGNIESPAQDLFQSADVKAAARFEDALLVSIINSPQSLIEGPL